MNLIRNEQFEIIYGNEKLSVNLKFIVEWLNDDGHVFDMAVN